MLRTATLLSGALAAGLGLATPTPAAASDPFVGALVGGLVGGAVVGALARPSVRYYDAGATYYYDAPVVVRRHAPVYAEPVYVERAPRCVIRQEPLFDRFGNVAAFQPRRVCR